jgi:hypothetical protein
LEKAPQESKSLLQQANTMAGDAAASFAKGASESMQWAASAKGRESASQAAASIARTTSDAASYVASAPATKAATKATTETATWLANLVGKAAHQAGTGAVEAANATMWSFLGRMAGFAIVLVMAGGFAYGLGTSLPKVLAGSISWGGLTKRDPDAPGLAERAGETSAAVASSAKQAWSRARSAVSAASATTAAATSDSNDAADHAGATTATRDAGAALRQSMRARWEAAKAKAKTAIDKADPRNTQRD